MYKPMNTPKKKHIKKRRYVAATPPSPSTAPRPRTHVTHTPNLTKLYAQVLEAKVTALEGYVTCLHEDNARLASGILADTAEKGGTA